MGSTFRWPTGLLREWYQPELYLSQWLRSILGTGQCREAVFSQLTFQDISSHQLPGFSISGSENPSCQLPQSALNYNNKIPGFMTSSYCHQTCLYVSPDKQR